MHVFEYILVSKDEDGVLNEVEDHGFVVAKNAQEASYKIGQLAGKKHCDLELEVMVRPFRS
jgi:hypothetical protein